MTDRKSLIPDAQMRRLSQRLVSIQGRIDVLERASRSAQLGHSSLDGGTIVINDASGLPRGYVGIQPDGTSGIRAVNGPPPSRPNTPEVEGIIDGVKVSWNGDFADGRPGDFSHLNVHVSGAGEDFIEGPSNLATAFTEAGSFPVNGIGPGTFWVRFIAFNTSGEASEPSLTASASSLAVVASDVLDGIVTEVKLADGAATEAKIAAAAVTVTKVADNAISTPKLIAGAVQAEKIAAGAVLADKIAANAVTAEKILALAITADKIAANAIEAGHILAGAVTADKLEAELVLANRIIVGTAGGNRVELHDTQGLQQWLDGVRTLHVPPNGEAVFTGTVTAGGDDQYIRLVPADADTSFPRLLLQDDTSTRRVSLSFQNETLRFRRETIDVGQGLVRGGQVQFTATYAAFNYYNETTGLFRGGLGVFNDQTQVISRTPADTGDAAYVTVHDNGDAYLSGTGEVRIFAGNDIDLFLNASGDGQAGLWEGETLKAFVIDHPADPARRLVHVCTESPNAMVEYVGVASLVGGVAEVELPGYFEALTDVEGRTVTATLVLPDVPLKRVRTRPNRPQFRDGKTLVDLRRPRKVDLPEHALMPPVAASLPVDGRFRIACGAPDGTKVSWRVTANRKNSAFDVEPLASEVPLPDGPYGVAIPKNAA